MFPLNFHKLFKFCGTSMLSVNKKSFVFCGFLSLLASQFAVVESQLVSDAVGTVGNVVTNVTSVVESPTTKALCNLTTVDLSSFSKMLGWKLKNLIRKIVN